MMTYIRLASSCGCISQCVCVSLINTGMTRRNSSGVHYEVLIKLTEKKICTIILHLFYYNLLLEAYLRF